MKERITYIQDAESTIPLTSDTINLSKAQQSGTFSLTDVLLKEHRISFTSDDVPPYLWRLLRNVHELHVRFQRAGSRDFLGEFAEPYVSRIPPGLHVSFTPLEGRSAKRMCVVLREVFGEQLKCGNTEDAFTSPMVLSERFASGASRQYFYPLPSLLDLSVYLREHLCPRQADSPNPSCVQLAHALRRVVSMDVDFDAISQILTVSAIWTQGENPQDPKTWNDKFAIRPDVLAPEHGEHSIEVGVLRRKIDPVEEAEELSFAGLLSQVGKDKSPSQTAFSFVSRHHASDLTFSTKFQEPTGLHPTLQISFPTQPVSPARGCALHAYFTLPSPLFIDKYPFSDPLFLASHNLAALHALSGATDLEAPEWTTTQWGSAALVELANPTTIKSTSMAKSNSTRKEAYSVTLPLHLRYLPPANASHVLQRFPDPAIFWACPSENSGTKFASSPFDRVNIGYDSLFGGNTLFYHGSPVSEPVTVSVPVLDLREAGWVGAGTVGAVCLGMGLVIGALGWGVWKDGFGVKKSSSREVEKKTSKRKSGGGGGKRVKAE